MAECALLYGWPGGLSFVGLHEVVATGHEAEGGVVMGCHLVEQMGTST